MDVFESWQPCQRIKPRVQLEYRNPVLKRDDYEDVEECEKPISDSGPAAENGENMGVKV